jgi:biotin carboxyl carrier protein
MKQQYVVYVGEDRLDVTLERTGDHVDAQIGDRHYHIKTTAVEPGILWLNWNQRNFESIVTEGREEEYTVSIGDHRLRVEVLDARKALRRAAHHGHDGIAELRAPMPGKIVRVLAAEGDSIEANQGVVVMEAMKMQNEIKSPKRGKILKVSVQAGAAVNSGDTIALVE